MIEPQDFALSDIPRVLALGFLEALLSADNAIVLGVLTRSLPSHLRKKALYVGVVSAFVLRAGALFAISFLLSSIWFQLLGGAYLLYLSIHHFVKKTRSPTVESHIHSFWKVVFLIELFDLLFAIDSIVAGVAFINSNTSKLWIVYLGGILGILGMRYAASFFSSLLDRFPRLETSAYLMVGWIGIKLSFSALHMPLPPPLFWSLIALFFLFGFYKPREVS
jgi:YkoY family integral membrane protein